MTTFGQMDMVHMDINKFSTIERRSVLFVYLIIGGLSIHLFNLIADAKDDDDKKAEFKFF